MASLPLDLLLKLLGARLSSEVLLTYTEKPAAQLELRQFSTARTTESGDTGFLRTHAALIPPTSRLDSVTMTTGMGPSAAVAAR